MIKLWDGYVIDSDEYQFVLGIPNPKVGKDGILRNNVEKATYHPTLGKALESFYKKQTRECMGNKEMTLAEYLQSASEIEERIRALVQEPEFKE